MALPHEEMGRRAVELLLSGAPGERVLVPMPLVERASTRRVRNTGERAGTDLVQLYARDVFASVTRPVAQ
ncbi:hypothetical protein, partial [Rathayibacter sp. AY1F8]|uniref:hypothetical protein n=1 Tax=Rathayibacter sp. AY1F8 TaxID=2080562 RepID=UPI0035BE7B56